jgi:hypothetical protein
MEGQGVVVINHDPTESPFVGVDVSWRHSWVCVPARTLAGVEVVVGFAFHELAEVEALAEVPRLEDWKRGVKEQAAGGCQISREVLTVH